MTNRDSFRSFDGGVHTHGARVRPGESSLKGMSELEEKTLAGKRPRIASGAGMSFAAAGFGENKVSVDMTGYRQVLGFDVDKNIIEVQAGATMGDIYNYLLGQGRYLVTQPGYPSITAGGCIAVDIHGKNQLRDGNFSDHVESIKLAHPAYGVIEVSERFNREIFELTMGGYGLTGTILSARLRTKPLPGLYMELNAEPVERFEDTAKMMAAAAQSTDFAVSWHDLTASADSPAAFGRGFILSGKFIEGSGPDDFSAPGKVTDRLTLRHKQYVDSRNVDGLGLNFYSMPLTRLINVLYGGLQRMRSEPVVIPVAECLYPSKRTRDLYYNMFGPAGFHESQVIVPLERFGEYIEAVRDWIGRHELPITLASSKYFGGSQKLLRFAGPGLCFALNFPRCKESMEFMAYLDKLCLRLGLLPYIVKDSRLPADVVKGCYSEYDNFRTRLKAYDRDRLYSSELSDRLGL